MAIIIRRRILFDRATFTWSAVLAGVATALIVQVMLTMLGLGISLIAFDTTTAANTSTGVRWSAFAYWAAAGIIAAFAGGWVAGALAAPRTGGGHALAAWAVATLVVVAVGMMSAGTTAGVASNLIGPTAMSIARYDRAVSDRNDAGTAGQQAVTNRQEIDRARRQVARGMLGSFIALLIGAAAAFAAGRMANADDELEEDTRVVN